MEDICKGLEHNHKVRSVQSGAITRDYRDLGCQGVTTITSSLKKQDLTQVNEELRRTGLLDSSIPLPRYTAVGNIGMLIGMQHIQLDPVLIAVLPNAPRVNRCPFMDIWNSEISYARPHPSFTTTPNCKKKLFLFTKLTRNLEKDERRTKKPRLCHLAPPGWGDHAQQEVRHRQRHQPNTTQALPGS